MFLGVDVNSSLKQILLQMWLHHPLNKWKSLKSFVIKKKKNKSLYLHRAYRRTESVIRTAVKPWSCINQGDLIVVTTTLKYVHPSSEYIHKGLVLMWSSGWASKAIRSYLSHWSVPVSPGDSVSFVCGVSLRVQCWARFYFLYTFSCMVPFSGSMTFFCIVM